jgi:hypothetical protein
MPRLRIQMPAPRLSGLLSDVHRLATGRELQLNDALDYFGDPKRLASIVERSGVLAVPSKRRKFESLLSESRHGV